MNKKVTTHASTKKKSSFKKLKKRFKLFLFVGSTNHTKLLKVKLDDISPNLKISFFSVRERFFFNEFFFSWTLSCSSACFLEWVLFSWTRACFFGRVHVFLFSFFSFINSQSDHKINCTCLISMPMPYFFDNYRYAYHNITNGNSIYL